MTEFAAQAAAMTLRALSALRRGEDLANALVLEQHRVQGVPARTLRLAVFRQSRTSEEMEDVLLALDDPRVRRRERRIRKATHERQRADRRRMRRAARRLAAEQAAVAQAEAALFADFDPLAYSDTDFELR